MISDNRIDEALKALFAETETEGDTPDDRAKQLTALRAFATRFATLPHALGDVLTPRPSGHLKGRGRPHVVVEVIDPPLRSAVTNDGKPFEGTRLDLRVVTMIHGIPMVYLAQSADYEPYQQVTQ